MDISFNKLLLAAGFFAVASPAFAQEVSPCPDNGFPIDAVAEPWAENTRTFSNGAVRLVMLAYEDPAVAPFHLVMLYPTRDNAPMEGRTCIQISGPWGGFYALNFQELQARYDPAIGLIFSMPAEIYDDSLEGPRPVALEISYNQSTEIVAAKYR